MRAISADGIFAELRRRAVRRFAACFKFQPQAAFVRGDDLQFCRLANDGQIRLEFAFDQRARTGLRVFLVNQSGENDFRSSGRDFEFASSQSAESMAVTEPFVSHAPRP